MNVHQNCWGLFCSFCMWVTHKQIQIIRYVQLHLFLQIIIWNDTEWMFKFFCTPWNSSNAFLYIHVHKIKRDFTIMHLALVLRIQRQIPFGFTVKKHAIVRHFNRTRNLPYPWYLQRNFVWLCYVRYKWFCRNTTYEHL